MSLPEPPATHAKPAACPGEDKLFILLDLKWLISEVPIAVLCLLATTAGDNWNDDKNAAIRLVLVH